MSDATHTPEPERVTIDPRVTALIDSCGTYDFCEGGYRGPEIMQLARELTAALAANPSPPERVTIDRDVEVEFPDAYKIVHEVLYSVDEIRKGRRSHKIVEMLADAGLLAHPSPPTNAVCGVERSVIREAIAQGRKAGYDECGQLQNDYEGNLSFADMEKIENEAITDAVMDALSQTGEGETE